MDKIIELANKISEHEATQEEVKLFRDLKNDLADIVNFIEESIKKEHLALVKILKETKGSLGFIFNEQKINISTELMMSLLHLGYVNKSESGWSLSVNGRKFAHIEFEHMLNSIKHAEDDWEF